MGGLIYLRPFFMGYIRYFCITLFDNMDFIFIILGLVLLVLGGDWLLKSAVGMSLRLNVSKIVIGMTVEKVTLPENLCGWLNSRSKFARVGFMSHITAPFMQPGISNRQALEIFNAGNEVIELLPGVKVCQLILEEVRGAVKYDGRYKNQ